MKREALGTVQKQDLIFPLHALRCDGRSVAVWAHRELPSVCLHPKARVLARWSCWRGFSTVLSQLSFSPLNMLVLVPC